MAPLPWPPSRYCWHPGLSVAANCRMCLVEVKSGRKIEMPILQFDEAKQEYVPTTKPKLQPACQLDETGILGELIGRHRD